MRKVRKTWIPVVTGLIRRKGQVLVGLRPEEGSLPGVWEFPGGKIELGESPEEALCRELSEELGIEATVGELKYAASHNYGDTGILILFYEVKYWKGQPKPVHHTELQWVDNDKIKELSLPEANRKVLDNILKLLE